MFDRLPGGLTKPFRQPGSDPVIRKNDNAAIQDSSGNNTRRGSRLHGGNGLFPVHFPQEQIELSALGEGVELRKGLKKWRETRIRSSPLNEGWSLDSENLDRRLRNDRRSPRAPLQHAKLSEDLAATQMGYFVMALSAPL